ncbi:DUF456 domain-containing protein [Marininema halotolerans]|uniref:DUF456 domain-containing protein n=1 Tax=Marininema halotolerans TaxID=1155944 RepID=A0A1I6R6R9_9BACL|nr:DUF456 family protein [Marininema halotolerans]SFS60431.1 hypothetical protein SAMN05444972_104196 [Marininema halotolerans]
MDIVWWSMIILLFVLGFAGLFLPILPDALLLLGGFALYDVVLGKGVIPWSFWITAGVITVVIMVVDYVAGGIAARKYGGSRAATWAAIVGAIVGLVIGPIGMIIGPFVAVVLVELLQKKSIEEALKIGYGTLIGFLGGVLFKGVLMTGLIIWFLVLVL